MRKWMLAVTMIGAAAPAGAKDVELVCGSSCQPQFESITEDLVALIDYKAMGPAESTGIVGIGIGAVGTYVPIDADADWQAATGQDFSGLPLVGLQATKGLPLNIDLGVFYSTAPSTNVDVLGGELRYAILPGSTVSPALALRLSYVTVSGIESFDLETQSADISLSKGFGPITPYVGAGYVQGEADPDASTGLQPATVEDTKAFLGARVSLGLFEFTPEIGQIGDTVAYNLRLGFSFSF